MKIQATGNDNFSPFNCLPDEIVLEILNKLIDLKTLCICYVVCKRFCSIIVRVDTISFTAPPGFHWRTGGVFMSAIRSLKTFTCVKYVYIVLPSSSINTLNFDYEVDVDDASLLKWKINFGIRFDSFVFLSVNSVYETSQEYDQEKEPEEEEEEVEELKEKFVAGSCLGDAFLRLRILLDCNKCLPLLEKFSIKDSCKRGTVSVSGRKLTDLRNLLPEPSENCRLKIPLRKSHCYIPLLKLPVSGYVMKGVTMFLFEGDDIPDYGDYSFIYRDLDDDVVKDKEEAAYVEAITEILKKHKGQMKNLD